MTGTIWNPNLKHRRRTGIRATNCPPATPGPLAASALSCASCATCCGDGDAATCYIVSSRSTSRFRNVGGESQSAASRSANALVSGSFEFAIASS